MLKKYSFLIILFLFTTQSGIAQTLRLPITVTDGAHQQVLTIGMAPGATNGFDTGIDTLAPPSPPNGAFDARLTENDQDYFTDYRDTTHQTKTYVMSYAAASGEGPITLKWSPSKLKSGWTYTITDNIDGKSFSLDMSTSGSLDVSGSTYLKDGLRIVVRPVSQPKPNKVILALPVTVSDGANQQVLTVGMAPGATDGFNAGLDTLAPPPPPSGAFDARLLENNNAYFADYRDTTHQTKTYIMSYTAASGEGPITLKWDPSKLKSGWTYTITDNIDGKSFSLDMSTSGSLDVSSSAYLKGGLRIVLSPGNPILKISRTTISLPNNSSGTTFSDITFNVINTGNDTLKGSVTTNAKWISWIDPQSFALSGSDSTTVTLSGKYPFNRSQSDSTFMDSVKVSTNAGIKYVTISIIVTLIEYPNSSKPLQYKLSQNYPNPFNPSTNIRYSLPSAQHVTVRIYNTLGQLVATLVNKNQAAGSYAIHFNAHILNSGMYFYQIKAGNFTDTKKMILLK